ncbi:hypothetical protein [Maridesulfovibrio sp.]|uniref:hypothetical protein n=1 Tax=Maridesulfovibrio sp. TaxID=2795000 RepID=UPI002A186E97|nr:hypothetical protein [Maridesulfovibrio sp.]
MGESVLNPQLRKEITAAVAEGIAIGLQQTGNAFCCLEPDAAKAVGHFMGMVRDIGDGEHAKGIEKMREHHKAVGVMLEGRRAFWCMVFKMTATAGIVFIGMAIWEHFSRVVK